MAEKGVRARNAPGQPRLVQVVLPWDTWLMLRHIQIEQRGNGMSKQSLGTIIAELLEEPLRNRCWACGGSGYIGVRWHDDEANEDFEEGERCMECGMEERT